MSFTMSITSKFNQGALQISALNIRQTNIAMEELPPDSLSHLQDIEIEKGRKSHDSLRFES